MSLGIIFRVGFVRTGIFKVKETLLISIEEAEYYNFNKLKNHRKNLLLESRSNKSSFHILITEVSSQIERISFFFSNKIEQL